MKYLTRHDVITLHDLYVELFGGSLGVRDEKLLDSAISRSQASYGGEDLYKTVYEKAATLMHGILFNHPFIDGNKRTALFSASRFLYINGYELDMTNAEAVAFPLAVAKTRPDIGEMAKWFKNHCVKIK